MIVITDGKPEARYNSTNKYNCNNCVKQLDSRSLVNWTKNEIMDCRKKGIEVFGVYIGDVWDENFMKKMFGKERTIVTSGDLNRTVINFTKNRVVRWLRTSS